MTDLLDRARAVAGEMPDCEARDVVLALMREVQGRAFVIEVKPLEWDNLRQADRYQVYPESPGVWVLYIGSAMAGRYPTEDWAKAAADADNEARILPQITERSVADVRRAALTEAAEIATRLDSDNPGHWKVSRDDVAAAILARAEPGPKRSHPAHFAGGSGAAVKGVE